VLNFRVGPFPVRLEASFLITAVFLGWRGGSSMVALASWVLIVFISVLVHELGHALVGLVQGGRPEIVLQGMGGLTFPRLRTRTSHAQQILLSVAGPVAGLLPGIVTLIILILQQRVELTGPLGLMGQISRLSGARDPVVNLLATMSLMSVIWTVFNLVPVIPLDGGHVMESAITWLRKKPSQVLASWLSAVFGVLFAALMFFLLNQLFAALFFVYMAVMSVSRARQFKAGGPTAPASPVAPDAPAHAQITQALAAARDALNSNDFATGLQIAESLESSADPFQRSAGARVRAAVALLRGEFDEAGRQAGRAFSLAPSPDSATLAARAAVRAGQLEIARNWVKRAVEAGAPISALRGDEELAPFT